MAVVPLPLDNSKVRYLALTADTLPTDVADPGDKAIITDGPDKFFNGSAWVEDTSGAGGDTTDPLYVTGNGYDVQTTVTRPANTTPYTALDVVGGAVDLGVLGKTALPIVITGVELEIDVAAIPAGMTSFNLALYNVTPPSAIADNGAWDLPSGDRASFLGLITNITPGDLGSTLYGAIEELAIQKKLAGTHLFAYLITVGAFTPAGNSEVYKIYMHTRDM